MDDWVRVAAEAEFDEATRVEINGHELALFKLDDGIFALDDICSHEFSRLSEGEIWDDDVYCPKHGSRFNIRNGSVKGLPALKPVRSYTVKVENGEVFIQWK